MTPSYPGLEAETVLRCHPATPAPGIAGIVARVRWHGPGRLELRYVVRAADGAVALPEVRAAQFADRLWERTCFEAFVATERGHYWEINLAPSTQWAIYQFSAYRKDMARAEVGAPPMIAMRSGPGQIVLEARVDLPRSGPMGGDPARMALSAVIESPGGTRSYWALAHPSAQPDFHHPDAFNLPWPGAAAVDQGTR